MSFMKKHLEAVLTTDVKPSARLDVEQLKRNLVVRANAEVPEHIKAMSVSECRAEGKRLAGHLEEYPGKGWAYKIMDRLADGERLPYVNEWMARDALAQHQMREPGGDDES